MCHILNLPDDFFALCHLIYSLIAYVSVHLWSDLDAQLSQVNFSGKG